MEGTYISCLLRKITLLQKKCHPIVALLVTYWLQFEKRTILRLSLQPTIDQVHTILCTGSNKKEKSNRVTLSIVKYRRMRSQIHLTIWTNWMIQFTNNLNCRKSKKKQSNLSELFNGDWSCVKKRKSLDCIVTLPD